MKPHIKSRECSVEVCVSKVLARGLCRLHYDRAREAGLFGNPPCRVADCGRASVSRDLCRAHAERERTLGVPGGSFVGFKGPSVLIDQGRRSA